MLSNSRKYSLVILCTPATSNEWNFCEKFWRNATQILMWKLTMRIKHDQRVFYGGKTNEVSK